MDCRSWKALWHSITPYSSLLPTICVIADRVRRDFIYHNRVRHAAAWRMIIFHANSWIWTRDLRITKQLPYHLCYLASIYWKKDFTKVNVRNVLISKPIFTSRTHFNEFAPSFWIQHSSLSTQTPDLRRAAAWLQTLSFIELQPQSKQVLHWKKYHW